MSDRISFPEAIDIIETARRNVGRDADAKAVRDEAYRIYPKELRTWDGKSQPLFNKTVDEYVLQLAKVQKLK